MRLVARGSGKQFRFLGICGESRVGSAVFGCGLAVGRGRSEHFSRGTVGSERRLGTLLLSGSTAVLETLHGSAIFIQSLSDLRSGGPDEPRGARGELLARQLFNELHGTSALWAADDLGARLARRVVGWRGLWGE